MMGAGLEWGTLPRHPPRPPSPSNLARALNAAAPDDRTWRWSVTHAQASQGALVVNADVLDLVESLQCARAIVEPVRGRYTEVLVYLRQFGSKSHYAGRRVQWTATGGYKETVLDASP